MADLPVLEVAIAVAVVVISILLLGFLKRRLTGPVRNSVLLLGLSGSGKTALLSQVVNNRAAYTVASMTPNIAEYTAQHANKRRTVRLCDVPGEDRVRTASLDSYLPSARGIIFVVDCANLKNNVKNVAKFLFELLTNETVVRNRTSFLIACNKQDAENADSSDAVRRALETELSVVRRTLLASTESNAASTLLNYKQSGQSKVREMTADIRASQATSTRIEQVFGDSESVSFDRVARAFPVRFAECSAGKVDETLAEPNADTLKNVSHRVEVLREWMASL